MKYPSSLEKLIAGFMRYPGVGRKSAERFALYTINKIENDEAREFANAIIEAKNNLKHCRECGFIAEGNKCEICESQDRDNSTIMVVEEIKDVIAIEKTERYNGLYHILNGAISPLNGVGPEDINLASLLVRLTDENIKELIIATNASVEGETTALYIRKLLQKTDLIVSRIAYGVPAGSQLEYADEVTLFKAIEGRRQMN